MSIRTDRSPLTEWRLTVDPYLLFSIIALIIFGVVLSFAASPPVAERINAGAAWLSDGTRGVHDEFYFTKRQAFFAVAALPILIGTSFLSANSVKRIMMLLLFFGIICLALVLFVGPEIKGAHRWLSVAGFSFQPSEIVKPALIVVSSWLFAEQIRNPKIPGNLMAFALLGIVVALLALEPDMGQIILTVSSWMIVFYVAGMSFLWKFFLAILLGVGLYGAYIALPHFPARIEKFVQNILSDNKSQAKGDSANYQADMAHESFLSGEWLGKGPGEGSVKWLLPDSHTDFVFAVLGEEFGIVACLIFVSAIFFILCRGFYHALRIGNNLFVRLSITGLVAMFGLQSAINMSVNLQLIPSKGMTLPFVSYGGTSLLSLAFAIGCLVALCRTRGGLRYTNL